MPGRSHRQFALILKVSTGLFIGCQRSTNDEAIDLNWIWRHFDVGEWMWISDRSSSHALHPIASHVSFRRLTDRDQYGLTIEKFKKFNNGSARMLFPWSSHSLYIPPSHPTHRNCQMTWRSAYHPPQRGVSNPGDIKDIFSLYDDANTHTKIKEQKERHRG